MAHRPKPKFGDALSYSETDWLRYGDVANPSTRQKMILLGIEQVVEVGPVDFSAVAVCDRLDIKHPMVNHYFGNRDNFLSEITWWAYQSWVRSVNHAFRSAPADPRKRLRSFINGEIEWAKKMGAVLILIHYPLVSQSTLTTVTEEHQAEMQRYCEYHLALITLCVSDIRNGTVSPIDFDEHTVPKAKLLKKPSNFLTATQISWAVHGLAAWSTGKHVPTETLGSERIGNLTSDYAVKQMIKAILAMAEK